MRYPLPNMVLLRQFVAIAEHDSISEAARSLNITQPALSKSIRKLEKTVGADLIERFAGGIRLTAAGETFITHARTIGLEYEHALQNIRNVVNDQESTINLSAGPIWSSMVMPTILGRFHHLFPKVRLNVCSKIDSNVIEEIRRGRIEIFAGAVLEAGSSDDVTVRRVATSNMAVLASKSHPLAQRPVVSPQDISACPFAVFSPSAHTYEKLAAFMHRHEAPIPKVVLETTSIQSCIEVTSRENFLFFETTMIPKSAMGKDLVALNLGEELHTFDVGLVFRNGLERIPHYARLMTIMADAMVEFTNSG